ncbi:hypothetical protein [Inmirania thermothiophila]|uniref:Dethiobiotin synthetase n=1 Tax=Inmirania thermothiophila TaxID=1750597 RepID=A0A3N1Y2N5_9GAMM|nr:hypothetical protein [Inmirania thermothiophila]ROR32801.1 dethiobiotin synthetase [Inmirania thermothiophila]
MNGIERIGGTRLRRAKKAYTTRRVDWSGVCGLVHGRRPQAGDLVLARVAAIGQHKRIELADGRRARLFRGDEVVVAYGNRYAPDQFEAVVPADLGPCDLVAAGGVAARARSAHDRMQEPTRLEPVGLLAGADGAVLNLRRYRLARRVAPRVPTIAVVGTSMNAGKTTTAAGIVHGMRACGLRVGAAKITGTGAGGDVWHLTDAGAEHVLDFVDAGHASTYLLEPAAVEEVLRLLTAELAARGVEAVVLEVADGLYQRETEALLTGTAFAECVDAVFFAAGDAMGAVAGAQWLAARGRRVLGISGALTRSPLAVREAQAACAAPVLDLEGLWSLDWRRAAPGRAGPASGGGLPGAAGRAAAAGAHP